MTYTWVADPDRRGPMKNTQEKEAKREIMTLFRTIEYVVRLISIARLSSFSYIAEYARSIVENAKSAPLPSTWKCARPSWLALPKTRLSRKSASLPPNEVLLFPSLHSGHSWLFIFAVQEVLVLSSRGIRRKLSPLGLWIRRSLENS
jgi:hypothetical protein